MFFLNGALVGTICRITPQPHSKQAKCYDNGFRLEIVRQFRWATLTQQSKVGDISTLASRSSCWAGEVRWIAYQFTSWVDGIHCQGLKQEIQHKLSLNTIIKRNLLISLARRSGREDRKNTTMQTRSHSTAPVYSHTRLHSSALCNRSYVYIYVCRQIYIHSEYRVVRLTRALHFCHHASHQIQI